MEQHGIERSGSLPDYITAHVAVIPDGLGNDSGIVGVVHERRHQRSLKNKTLLVLSVSSYRWVVDTQEAGNFIACWHHYGLVDS